MWILFVYPLSNILKKSQEALLKRNDKDLFKGLRVCKPEILLRQYPECSKGERKVQEFYRKKYVLEKNQFCVLSLESVQDSIHQLSSGLGNGTFSFEAIQMVN